MTRAYVCVFQSYEISVAAYNEKGTGVYSFSKRMRTNEGTPTQPPRQLDVVAASSTSLSITWYQPNPQHINGVNQVGDGAQMMVSC